MTKTVTLSKSCEFNLVRYENGARYLTLDYIEYSPAHGYSDTETSIDIDEKTAQEIIDMLSDYLKKRRPTMKVIKFRAWDAINKKMYPVAFPTWNGMVEGKIDFVSHAVETIEEDGDDKPILMQFTECLDDYDNEIFEGDLVMCFLGIRSLTRQGYLRQVEFLDGSFQFLNVADSADGVFWNDIIICHKIGNIYENPELLSQ